ncbi:MAG: outer membrane protein [Pseudolabrys sp.]
MAGDGGAGVNHSLAMNLYSWIAGSIRRETLWGMAMTLRWMRAAIAAMGLLVSGALANAADLPRPGYKAPLYSAPAYMNWSGFYIGLNAGYGFGTSNWTSPGFSPDFQPKGFIAGGTIGYNFQTGSWVWGLEGDFDYSGMKGTNDTVCAPSCETKNTWLGTGRVRLGYAGWNGWLPYITGGAAIGNLTIAQGASFSKTKVGWTAGAGLEYALLSNWSVKGEYLYVDLGNSTCPATDCGAPIDFTFKAHLVKLGLNYRF